ncbi:small oligopeptide opt family [Phlyctema vagabunda]|uniref:Small oligopeptide opt family n=1 Tax=Phlyctema vagabunda TaxID=108571 RepID=A0ABR4P9I2_9HELO
MHRNPSVTANSLKFFTWVALATFVYQWFPSFIFPMLSSLPLICYMGHGKWIAYLVGSGYNGFGILNLSLDWNYIGFWQPFYTPLWANAHNIAGAIIAVWGIYPIMYFTNTLDSLKYPPMSSGTFDDTGSRYNTSRVLNADFTLNQAAMDAYSMPHWSGSYAMCKL